MAPLARVLPLLTLVACGPRPVPMAMRSAPPPPRPEAPNILFLLADDIGVDQLAAYGVADEPARTPVIDRLAANGVVFERAWASPVCSPTRASVLTGTYSFRNGVGAVIQNRRDDVSVSHEVWTIPKALAEAPVPYASTAIGKWHLGTWSLNEETDPLEHGFQHYAGGLANLVQHQAWDRRPQNYHDWELSVDGERRGRSDVFATEYEVDATLDAIREMPEPWFAWVGFHAAHGPFNEPPRWMWKGGPTETPRQRYQALVESLDSEIGRLLESMNPETRANTIVVFLGDNGTPAEVVIPPLSSTHAKGSMYEGGVRVPLIVTGPGVAQGRTDALVNHTDLLATFADLAGLPADHPARTAAADSYSLHRLLLDPAQRGPRNTVYSEKFKPNGVAKARHRWERAIRDAQYKLILRKGGPRELYALGDGYAEDENLMDRRLGAEEREALEALIAQLPR